MGHATVRHSRFEKMVCVVGLRFIADFGLSDQARRKILSGLLGGGIAMGVAAVRSFRFQPGSFRCCRQSWMFAVKWEHSNDTKSSFRSRIRG
jgi:hypothetical protein